MMLHDASADANERETQNKSGSRFTENSKLHRCSYWRGVSFQFINLHIKTNQQQQQQTTIKNLLIMTSPDRQLSWNQSSAAQEAQEVNKAACNYNAYREIMEACRPFYALENTSSMPFYQNEILPRLEDSIALQSQRRLSSLPPTSL
jgi:hypothetical protein